MAEEDVEVWKSYIKANGSRPKNASQLMKWSKSNEHSRNLSFSQAKKIYGSESKKPIEQDEIKENGPVKPKVDMTNEKTELKEYISECKEELMSLQNRELSMEDDYEEGNEGLETQFEELEKQLKQAREEISTHRKTKYDDIQNAIKSQKQTLEETLRILRKVNDIYHYMLSLHIKYYIFYIFIIQTLSECDIKGDKEEVKTVLSNIPQLEEIDEYQFQPINIDPAKKALEALVQSANVEQTNEDQQ